MNRRTKSDTSDKNRSHKVTPAGDNFVFHGISFFFTLCKQWHRDCVFHGAILKFKLLFISIFSRERKTLGLEDRTHGKRKSKEGSRRKRESRFMEGAGWNNHQFRS